ncbi:MAG: hypothetical protein II438_10285 [Clostridiales bacterium]|nr:hypothetical protein [Clostridiales bacterium]
MSENNSGAFVPQQDNRSGDQNREKRQKFDPAKQDGRRNNYNRNRRRRNNGPRQGGYDKKGDNAEVQAEGRNQNQGQNQNQNRERNSDRQNNRDKNNNNKFNKREQNQGSEKRQQFNGERKPKNKRSRELDAEVAKNVKKVETIEDIRSDNARITKEIYLEIASLKNINLN